MLTGEERQTLNYRQVLEEEAGAFVSLHSLPAKDKARLVQAALQRLEKARKKR